MKKNKNQIKVLLTGGHAGSTAFAVIEEIERQKKHWSLYFIGGKSSVEGKKSSTLYDVNWRNSKVSFIAITTGRLQRKMSFWTIPSLLKVPLGVIQTFIILLRLKPDVIMSFGGFASVPVVLSSAVLKIPVIIHEQTTVVGKANLFSQKFARKIALARESSLRYFDSKKCVVTGNPVSFGVTKIKIKKRLSRLPTVLVTGGASGSLAINNIVDKNLEKLLKDYTVIHQTGEWQKARFTKRKNELDRYAGKRYKVYSVIPSDKWPSVLGKADILISRSGANIISEIITTKKPAILIPIPFSYLNEQYKNAIFAKKYTVVEIIEQKEFNGETLLNKLEVISNNWSSVVNKIIEQKNPDINASTKLVNLIEEILNETKST